MKYSIQFTPSSVIAKIEGILTFEDKQDFKELLITLTNSQAPYIIFALDALRHIDFAGIGMILIADKRSKAEGKEFQITGAQGQVAQALQLARMQSVVKIIS